MADPEPCQVVWAYGGSGWGRSRVGGQDGAGEAAGWKSGYGRVGSRLWEHCPLELRSKVGKRTKKRALKLLSFVTSCVGRSRLSTLFHHCADGEPQDQLQGHCSQGLMDTLIPYLASD